MAFAATPDGARGALNSADPLPVTVDQVTAEWFTKILGAPVKIATLVKPIHGTASKLLYELTYENSSDASTLPKNVCVKGGFNPDLIKAYPSLNAVYRREADFFYYMASTMGMRLPRSWYSGSDIVTGQGIVVLEDLYAGGFTFGEPTEPWPVDRVRANVEQLAILHAKTWGMGPADFPWLDAEAGPGLEDVVLSLMSESKWAERYHDPAVRPPIPEHLTADRERMIRALKTLWATHNKDLLCVAHGDCHLGNTFVSPAGEPGFLDWQGWLPSYSAFHDVPYFIVGALTVEDRRANEVELLEHYLDCLHKAGGPKLEKDAVWDEYRKHAMYGFVWSLTPPMMQSKERVDVMSVRYCTALVDHKSLQLLESLPEYIKEI